MSVAYRCSNYTEAANQNLGISKKKITKIQYWE